MRMGILDVVDGGTVSEQRDYGSFKFQIATGIDRRRGKSARIAEYPHCDGGYERVRCSQAERAKIRPRGQCGDVRTHAELGSAASQNRELAKAGRQGVHS